MSTAQPRVALVTGANRGLGFETARQLLARGLVVVLTGRDIRALERARRSLPDADQHRAIVVAMEVTSVDSIAEARQAVTALAGRIDIVVNIAAILVGEHDAPLSIAARDYRGTVETNLFGVIEVCRAFVPAMAHAGYGRVVNVSSGAGQLATMSAYAPAYSISKAAVNAFTRVLADSYRGDGVLVNAADPGWVRTDMGGRSAPRSVQEGADTVVWLATLPDGGPTGGFFRDRRAIDW
ncbi:MAG: SDR family NAD(P)-dependent oxidoreductase [Acidobacteria bacterium]|nr:SDR family NAD(P)-dependent oxidoreductase [Acidobacteriota bacterium]